MFTEIVNGIELTFETTKKVFSPDNVDKGTLAMISSADFTAGGKILDLGCGYGAVGIYAAKLAGEGNVVMSDIDRKCVELAKRNAVLNGVSGVKVTLSDGFEGIDDTDFALILSNPPYHADFSVPKRFIEKGFNRLRLNGRFHMVTKRLEWYKNKLTAVFGGVKVSEIGGYYVFTAEKRGYRYASKK
jgi:16S rRNA (guanine1207-N2)-methyltransferase